MRYLKWLPVAVTALALVGGCSSSREMARRKLADELDKARRRYDHATNLTDYPFYLDTSTGARSPVYRKLDEQGLDVPATRPALDDRPLKVLDEAERLLANALAEAAGNAPENIKGDAELLLGKICLAKARHRIHVGESFRADADRRRRSAAAMIEGIYNRLSEADDNKAIAIMPRDKIVARTTALNRQVEDLAGKISVADKQIAKLVGEIAVLNKASAAKRPEAQRLRDRSEVTTGPKGLELLTAAQAIEAQIDANAGKVAAKQQAMAVLSNNKALLGRQHQLVKAELTEVGRHLAAIGKSSSEAADSAKAAQAEAVKFAGQVEAEASAAEQACRKIRDRETQALSDLAKALGHFRRAASAAEAEVRAAAAKQPQEGGIVASMADDAHLASVLCLKASASLTMAEVRSRQLSMAGTNAALGVRMTQAWKRLSQPSPPAAAALGGYLADPAKARKEAEDDYKAAEADLERIDGKLLRSGAAKNTKWMYQGSLAAAYLGHYRLTGERAIFDKADELVDKALRDKEESPYLEPVRRLRELVRSAGN